MVSTNIIGSMRDFIVNNNTIKTAPIASRFTFIISAVMVGGKCDGVDLRHINHNALIGSDRSHKLADLSCMNWAYGHAPHTGDTFAFVGF